MHFNPIEVEEFFLSAIIQSKIMKYNLLENWVTEMNGGDLGRLTSLYSQDAILFATFEEQPLDTPDLIHGYFKSFFSLEGAGVELDSSTVTNSELGENCCSSTGLYTFFFMENGHLIRQKARFTFIFTDEQPGAILHHHSSLIPS